VSQNVYDAAGIASQRAVPDFKENFESGNVNDEVQPNIWLPEEALPGFRGFMEGFFEVSGLGFLNWFFFFFFFFWGGGC
jgi:hypothetical protein